MTPCQPLSGSSHCRAVVLAEPPTQVCLLPCRSPVRTFGTFPPSLPLIFFPWSHISSYTPSYYPLPEPLVITASASHLHFLLLSQLFPLKVSPAVFWELKDCAVTLSFFIISSTIASRAPLCMCPPHLMAYVRLGCQSLPVLLLLQTLHPSMGFQRGC